VGKNNKCSEVSKERGDLQTGIVNIMETLGTKNSDSGKKYHALIAKPPSFRLCGTGSKGELSVIH
jgi:hypothetical protein